MKRSVNVTINGRACQEEVEPRLLLPHFLREVVGLTGTHVGCVIGECGACTILLDGKLVKSCLLFAVQVDGREITTIEGLAENGKLHPIQEAFIERYGFQCGYCTPGMVLAAHSLLKRNSDPSEEEIRRALAGNLCMCTGYAQIIESVQEAAKKLRSFQRSA
jgi:carbon-monoxide dehydrogenase small subunit